MTESATHEAQEAREIEEAGERRRAAMERHDVQSYRSLRVELNDGADKLERRAEASDASFLPTHRSVPWGEFVAMAVRRGVVADPNSAPDLLHDLLRGGHVRVTGSIPNAFVRRPAVPSKVEFHSNGHGEPELLNALSTIERLRRENRHLRSRLEALTGESR